MDRYRYFIFNQRSVVVLGILQIACAGLCVVCGFIDAAFRKDTTLSNTRIPLWAGVIMGIPGVLALFSSQKKNPLLVTIMTAASLFSCFTTMIIIVYCSLTLSYGEEDDELFHPYSHIRTQHAKFVLTKLIQGANLTMLIACTFGILLALFIAFTGYRSIPYCACYDSVTGLESLDPDDDQNLQTELVCTRLGGDSRLFNAPVQLYEQEEEISSKPPPYVRLV
ncbi:uncharacterized protein LOC121325179 isoform X2 [Polyodon spathula]|uniref:uncharacterized protein LOC121325179 isoform X2 n=1 Tax=Polyodon spathula TaxID=7913 RepID=UPI001B7E2878|nr:uncharacterized protein LOC121325179 isoform X2 [Polyodon spathula]